MKTKIKEINFKFNDKNILKTKFILKKYPKKFSSSALLPLLHLAQDQLDGWLNKPAIEYIAKYLNISEADMEKGNLRCDANVSLRPQGDTKLYPKTEIKNLNF